MRINQKNKAIFDAAVKDYLDNYGEGCPHYKGDSEYQLNMNAFKFAVRELSYKAMLEKDYHIQYGNIAYENMQLFDVVIPHSFSTNTFGEISVITLGLKEIPADEEYIVTDNCLITHITLSDGSMDDDQIVTQIITL